MSKLVKRLNYLSMSNIGVFESYLSDMAKKGLLVRRIGIFNKFEKGNPTNLEYRLEAWNGKIEAERMNRYKEYGWNYITSYRWAHVFCNEEGSDYREIHTDPVEHGYTMNGLMKRMRIATALIMIAFFIVFLNFLFINHLGLLTPISMAEDGFAGFIWSMLGYSIMITIVLYDCISFYRLRKQLFLGKQMNHHASWKQSYYINKTLTVIVISSSLVLNISQVYSIVSMINGSWRVNLLDVTWELPVVRLSDIEEGIILSKETDQEDNDIDYSNKVDIKKYIMTSVKYEVRETVIIDGETWEDGTENPYSPSLQTTYYKLRFSFLSDPLLHSLIEKELSDEFNIILGYQLNSIKSMSISGLDEAYYLKFSSDNPTYLFARKGKEVVQVTYFGKEDITKIGDQLAKVLSPKQRN